MYFTRNTYYLLSDDVHIQVQYIRVPICTRLPTARQHEFVHVSVCNVYLNQRRRWWKKNHFLDRYERTKRLTLYKYVCFNEPSVRRLTAKKEKKKNVEEIKSYRAAVYSHPRFACVCRVFVFFFFFSFLFLIFNVHLTKFQLIVYLYVFRSHTRGTTNWKAKKKNNKFE